MAAVSKGGLMMGTKKLGALSSRPKIINYIISHFEGSEGAKKEEKLLKQYADLIQTQ